MKFVGSDTDALRDREPQKSRSSGRYTVPRAAQTAQARCGSPMPPTAHSREPSISAPRPVPPGLREQALLTSERLHVLTGKLQGLEEIDLAVSASRAPHL